MSDNLSDDQKMQIEVVGHLKGWADESADKCYKYMMSQDGGMSEASLGLMADQIRDSAWRFIRNKLSGIRGGYNYMGACSDQICFPLRNGGELRFSVVDEDVADGEIYSIDLYDGALPPCITGFSKPTGS